MIKKLLLKMVVVPAVLLGGYGYVMYQQTGKVPFFDSDSGGMSQSTKSLRGKITSKESMGSASTQKLLKWKDENGQWHFGDRPPADVMATSIEYDRNRNIISAVKITKNKSQESKFGMPNSSKGRLADRLTGDASDAYNPENISQTISDAKNLQETLNNRMEQQQEALNAIGAR